MKYVHVYMYVHSYTIWFMGTVEYRSNLLNSAVFTYLVNNSNGSHSYQYTVLASLVFQLLLHSQLLHTVSSFLQVTAVPKVHGPFQFELAFQKTFLAPKHPTIPPRFHAPKCAQDLHGVAMNQNKLKLLGKQYRTTWHCTPKDHNISQQAGFCSPNILGFIFRTYWIRISLPTGFLD